MNQFADIVYNIMVIGPTIPSEADKAFLSSNHLAIHQILDTRVHYIVKRELFEKNGRLVKIMLHTLLKVV